jgi:hypothetical protein
MTKIKIKTDKRAPTSQNGDAIGYKKPPVDTQFKPGKSGNPKGRPKAQPKLLDVVQKLLHKNVTINENGKLAKFPVHEVLIKTMISHAMKGKYQYMQLLMKYADLIEDNNAILAMNPYGDVNRFKWSDEHEHIWRLAKEALDGPNKSDTSDA